MAAVRQVNPQWPPSGERRASLACRNPEKHLIVAGTGRAGTSFLVRYLTELGLDTTLARNGDRASWDAEANAGLENLLVSGANLPYVIKSPWISEYVEQILKEERFKIDAFIVPVRDLVEVATSRVVLEQRAIHQHNPWMADQLDRSWETYGHTPGGLVYSLNPLDQARLLAVQFHQLVLEGGRGRHSACFSRIPKDRGRLGISAQILATDSAAGDYRGLGSRRPRQSRGRGEGSGHERNFQGSAQQRHLPEGAAARAALPEPDRNRQHRASARNQPASPGAKATIVGARLVRPKGGATEVLEPMFVTVVKPHYRLDTKGRFYFVTRKGELVFSGMFLGGLAARREARQAGCPDEAEDGQGAVKQDRVAEKAGFEAANSRPPR